MKQLLWLPGMLAILCGASCKKNAQEPLVADNISRLSNTNTVTGVTININSYPRLSGETDDQPRISRACAALQDGDILQLNEATYSLVSGTSITGLKSGITIQGVSWNTVLKVNKSTFFIPFPMSGLTGVTIKNLKIQGYGSTAVAGSDLIRLNDCSYCELSSLRLQSFPWNGIGLGGTATNNTISGITVTNGHGAGLILYGGNVHHNTVNNITAQYNGIGISLNYAHDNTIGTVVCVDNRCSGFALDGIGSTEGAHNNTISSITAERNGYDGTGYTGGGGAYGGLYIGNGGTYGNVITSVTSSNNYNAGICVRGAHDNTIHSITTIENDLNGIRLVNGNNNWFGDEFLNTHNNGQRGISLEGGSGTKVGRLAHTNNTQWNTGHGIYVGPSVTNSYIYHLYSQGNLGTGVYVAAGGTAWSNQFNEVNSTGNPAGNYYWGTSTSYWYW